MSVKLAVIEALDLDPDVPAAALGVLVDSGCVTLLGDAGSDGRRRLAREAAFTVVGARALVDAMHGSRASTDATTLRHQQRTGILLAELLERLAGGDMQPVRALIVDDRVSLRGRLSSSAAACTLIEAVREGIDLPLDDHDILTP